MWPATCHIGARSPEPPHKKEAGNGQEGHDSDDADDDEDPTELAWIVSAWSGTVSGQQRDVVELRPVAARAGCTLSDGSAGA